MHEPRPLWIRFLVKQGVRFFTPCSLKLAPKDCSFYLFPFGLTNTYHFGRHVVDEGETKSTVHYKSQLSSSLVPHISIHESGRVNAYQEKVNAVQPLQIPPLRDWRGQHVATVRLDRLESMCSTGQVFRHRGITCECPVEGDIPGAGFRLAFYVNGREPKYTDPVSIELDLGMDLQCAPLFLGIAYFANNDALGDAAQPGSVAIAGWNPHQDPQGEQEFLFVRAS